MDLQTLAQKRKEVMLIYQKLLGEERKLLDNEDIEMIATNLERILQNKEKVLAELKRLKELYDALAIQGNTDVSDQRREMHELAESIKAEERSIIVSFKQQNDALHGKISKLRQGKKMVAGYEPAYNMPVYFIDKKR